MRSSISFSTTGFGVFLSTSARGLASAPRAATNPRAISMIPDARVAALSATSLASPAHRVAASDLPSTHTSTARFVAGVLAALGTLTAFFLAVHF